MSGNLVEWVYACGFPLPPLPKTAAVRWRTSARARDSHSENAVFCQLRRRNAPRWSSKGMCNILKKKKNLRTVTASTAARSSCYLSLRTLLSYDASQGNSYQVVRVVAA